MAKTKISKENFKVKITKCATRTFWYANRIGDIFDVFEDPEDKYRYNLSEDREKYSKGSRIINVSDCEKV